MHTLTCLRHRKFFRDPKTYPDPLEFKPERFLGPEKNFDPRKYMYGYGRRTCPGVHLADASYWLACVDIIAAFDVTAPIRDGKPVLPSGKFLDGGIRYVLATCFALPTEC